MRGWRGPRRRQAGRGGRSARGGRAEGEIAEGGVGGADARREPKAAWPTAGSAGAAQRGVGSARGEAARRTPPESGKHAACARDAGSRSFQGWPRRNQSNF